MLRSPRQTASYPASRLSCLTRRWASSSPDHRLLGCTRASAIYPKTEAKLVLNAFAVSPPATDLTYSALEENPAGDRAPL